MSSSPSPPSSPVVADPSAPSIVDDYDDYYVEQQRVVREQEDADLAFALQQQIEEEEHARDRVDAYPGARRPRNLEENVHVHYSTDEEIARRLTEVEDRRAAAELARRDRVAAARPSPRRRLWRCAASTTAAGLTAYAMVFYVVPYVNGGRAGGLGMGGPLGGGGNWVDVWEEGEPREWRADRGGRPGLRLTIVDATTSDWRDVLAASVAEWNEAAALELSVETTTTPDPACRGARGLLKVCNGDYGATSWVGVNEVVLENGRIVSSVARMNEHYLRDADDNKRRYTMCHEIGHGFGLPHTDENFLNKDKGDCLDYTNTPQNNLRPGQRNFDKLETMYGRIHGKITVTTLTPQQNEAEASQTQQWDPATAPLWSHHQNNDNDQGLSLTLVNALSPDWYPHFDAVYRDWSVAPALAELRLASVPHDDDGSSCDVSLLEVGTALFCNVDRPDEAWDSVTRYVVEDDHVVVASASLLNDARLRDAATGRRRRALCRAMGRSLGLPENDDDENKNESGGCMYGTTDADQQPTARDFARLARAYGLAGTTTTSTSSTTTVVDQKRESNDDDNDRRRRSFSATNHDADAERRSEDAWHDRQLRARRRTTTASWSSSWTSFAPDREWRLVRRTNFDEVHEADLGKGRRVVARVVYA